MQARLELVVDLAQALHSCDTNAARLETTVADVGRALDLDVACFASPTALFVGLGGAPARMIRVQPADFDGEALVEIDGVARALAAGELSPAAARQRLARLRRREPLGSTTVLVAFAVVSASAAVLFGAGPAEALVAAGLGVLAAAIATVSTGPVRLGPLACALGVSVVAHALATWVPIVPERVTLAALIVLIPGLSLTMSLAELSEGHLVSGTARLGAVGMSFVQLGLGAGLGAGLLQVLPLSPPPVQSMPGWVEAVALAIAPLGIAVLMRVRWQDLAAVSVATWLGVLAARVGSDMGGPQKPEPLLARWPWASQRTPTHDERGSRRRS